MSLELLVQFADVAIMWFALLLVNVLEFIRSMSLSSILFHSRYCNWRLSWEYCKSDPGLVFPTGGNALSSELISI